MIALVTWLAWLMCLYISLCCVFVCLRQTRKKSHPSRNVCVVWKWVLIDAFSPFVCLMEKHFSLNCHSQICARVCVDQEEEREKERTEQVIIIQCERRIEGLQKRSGRRKGAEEPLQQLACHLKSFPSEPFDIEMKKSVSARGCWEISLTMHWLTRSHFVTCWGLVSLSVPIQSFHLN